MARLIRRTFRPGDHICAVYSGSAELGHLVADFIVQGLRNGERCWYIASATEATTVTAALRKRGVKVNMNIRRSALSILDGGSAYIVHGQFDPEATVKTFNDAIEAALKDGFTGFRAAAEMSWLLKAKDGAQRVIAYEALLRSLFATSSATGLCLYQRTRMPLNVLNGALATHPIVGVDGRYAANPYYSATASRLPASGTDVPSKLRVLAARGSRSR